MFADTDMGMNLRVNTVHINTGIHSRVYIYHPPVALTPPVILTRGQAPVLIAHYIPTCHAELVSASPPDNDGIYSGYPENKFRVTDRWFATHTLTRGFIPVSMMYLLTRGLAPVSNTLQTVGKRGRDGQMVTPTRG